MTIFAYIGPGAGFAFFGSFLGLVTSLFLTAVSFIVWPFRAALRLLRRKQGFRKARIQRLIFLGLDGLDPRLTAADHAGQLPGMGERWRRGQSNGPPRIGAWDRR